MWRPVGSASSSLVLECQSWASRTSCWAEAKVLFGLTPDKVNQLGRGFRYWALVKTVLESWGGAIAPEQENIFLERAWRVLMTAATVTQVEAVRYCIA